MLSYDFDKEPDPSRLAQAYRLQFTKPDMAILELNALAQNGSIVSLAYLGDMFRFGRGTKVNLAEAERYYLTAYKAGLIQCSAALGIIKLNQKNFKKAEEYLKLGVSSGYAPNLYILARLYLRGPKELRNPALGLELLEKAISLGHFYAKMDFSWYLMTGKKGFKGLIPGIKLRIATIFDGVKIILNDPNDIRLSKYGLH